MFTAAPSPPMPRTIGRLSTICETGRRGPLRRPQEQPQAAHRARQASALRARGAPDRSGLALSGSGSARRGRPRQRRGARGPGALVRGARHPTSAGARAAGASVTGPVRRARSALRMVTTSLCVHRLDRDARPCHRGESRSQERVLARGLTPGPEPNPACTAKRRLRPRRVAGADRSSGRRALPREVRRRPSRGRLWREHHAATPRMSICPHRRATLLEARSTTTCTRSVRVGASAAAGSRWLLPVPAAGPWRSHEEAGRRCLDGTRDPYRG